MPLTPRTATECVKTEMAQQMRFKYWKENLERDGKTVRDAVGADDLKRPTYWGTPASEERDVAALALARTQIPIPKKLLEPAREPKNKDTGPVVIGLGDYTLKMIQDRAKANPVPLPAYGTARGKTGPRAIPAEPALGRTRSEPRLLVGQDGTGKRTGTSTLTGLSGVTGSSYTWGYASNVSGLSRAEIIRAAESVLGTDAASVASTDRWSGPAESNRWEPGERQPRLGAWDRET